MVVCSVQCSAPLEDQDIASTTRRYWVVLASTMTSITSGSPYPAPALCTCPILRALVTNRCIRQGSIHMPPGTGLMRLANLLGLTSSADSDRVRALVAHTALDNGDSAAACAILSAAILRRPPRDRVVCAEGGQDRMAAEDVPFDPELCAALDLVIEGGSVRRAEGDLLFGGVCM